MRLRQAERWQWVWLGACALAGSLLSSVAAASELKLAAPRACSIGPEVERRTERALGQSIASAGEMRCTIHVARHAGMYAARMELEPSGGQGPTQLRSFGAPTCERLTETLTLAVVLALGASRDEPAAGGRGLVAAGSTAAGSTAAGSTATAALTATPESGLGQTSEPTPRRKPVVAAEVDAAPASVQEPAAEGHLRFGTRAGLIVDAGSLPGAGLGAMLGVSLGGDLLEARVQGTYLAAREASIQASSDGAHIELALLSGSLLGCAPRLLEAGRLSLGACVGGELGSLSGGSRGVTVALDVRRPWLAARADLAGRWALAPGLGLELLLSALAPLQREELYMSIETSGAVGLERVYEQAAVAGRASVGLSFELGGPARSE